MMRRADREIKDFDEIIDVLRRAESIRLGINGDPFPYVVPLSFGFEVRDGKVTVYFHGAKEGFKHELLAKNNAVCVEADIFHRYARSENGLTTEYESVIGFGRAIVAEEEDAAHGMDLLLEHCGYPGFAYDRAVLKIMRVYKIELLSITGKRRFV
ncbi:MAG: pyridoxamine 5'-phosphate oxidase family protein [Oscillospiraceae bacterium]|jgi:nitroimidazol reductase NimA-like FMN-containing flavoprotein (pyridoxamine 5'-phosphate oxidase superfamily)|nr:pyridoxamine 5'-phosphate oxidase family protein [Oscillospiraceae bacterium]